VEVYSNLARPISDMLWDVFVLPRHARDVLLRDRRPHARGDHPRPRGSHRLTRTNIIEAVDRDIPIRVGVVKVNEDQDVSGMVAELRSLGVTNVDVDHLRQIGRGVRNRSPTTSTSSAATVRADGWR